MIRLFRILQFSPLLLTVILFVESATARTSTAHAEPFVIAPMPEIGAPAIYSQP